MNGKNWFSHRQLLVGWLMLALTQRCVEKWRKLEEYSKVRWFRKAIKQGLHSLINQKNEQGETVMAGAGEQTLRWFWLWKTVSHCDWPIKMFFFCTYQSVIDRDGVICSFYVNLGVGLKKKASSPLFHMPCQFSKWIVHLLWKILW